MKASTLIFVLCVVWSANANAQFYQQPAAQVAPAPYYAAPSYPPYPPYPPSNCAPYAGGAIGGGNGGGGDHTLLQILAMQQLFAQQTGVQQGWAASQDRQLQEILAHQEAFRSQMTQREWFDQVIRGQQREREAFGQRDILEQLRARQQPIPLPVPQPPRRRGLLGLRADVQNEVIYQNTGY